MDDLDRYIEKRKKVDAEFAKIYNQTEPRMRIIQLLIEHRKALNITQKELSKRTGIAQAEINKVENGKKSPSIELLQKLADGMNMVLNVTFTSKEASEN